MLSTGATEEDGCVDGDGRLREPEIYFLGIIDILQLYNRKKKIEHFFKSRCTTARRERLSCVPPAEYASRFIDFIDDAIVG